MAKPRTRDVPRSVAMKLTGHKTEAVYRRYAIVAKSDLEDGVAKLHEEHPGPQSGEDADTFGPQLGRTRARGERSSVAVLNS